MNLNPLIEQAAVDRHSDVPGSCCGPEQRCLACGAHVSGYNANAALRSARPEAEGWDWWIACDNADCEHAYGEGLFQIPPEWVSDSPLAPREDDR